MAERQLISRTDKCVCPFCKRINLVRVQFRDGQGGLTGYVCRYCNNRFIVDVYYELVERVQIYGIGTVDVEEVT